MKRLLILVLLLIGHWCFPLQAQAPSDLHADFLNARDAFVQFIDSGEGFDSAWTQLTELEKAYPDHLAAQCYLGALETIKARDAWMPWTKMRWVEAGLDRLDRALGLLRPEHARDGLAGISTSLDCRLTAARTFLSVPGFLNRQQDANDVFSDLIEFTELVEQPVEVRRSIYRLGLDIAKADDNAEEVAVWSMRLQQLPPNTEPKKWAMSFFEQWR